MNAECIPAGILIFQKIIVRRSRWTLVIHAREGFDKKVVGRRSAWRVSLVLTLRMPAHQHVRCALPEGFLGQSGAQIARGVRPADLQREVRASVRNVRLVKRGRRNDYARHASRGIKEAPTMTQKHASPALPACSAAQAVLVFAYRVFPGNIPQAVDGTLA